jgi:hypothetical protein
MDQGASSWATAALSLSCRKQNEAEGVEGRSHAGCGCDQTQSNQAARDRGEKHVCSARRLGDRRRTGALEHEVLRGRERNRRRRGSVARGEPSSFGGHAAFLDESLDERTCGVDVPPAALNRQRVAAIRDLASLRLQPGWLRKVCRRQAAELDRQCPVRRAGCDGLMLRLQPLTRFSRLGSVASARSHRAGPGQAREASAGAQLEPDTRLEGLSAPPLAGRITRSMSHAGAAWRFGFAHQTTVPLPWQGGSPGACRTRVLPGALASPNRRPQTKEDPNGCQD